MIKNIDVVILSGGQGSRLRELISDRPKPMAEIDSRPFLDILMEYVAGFGFRRFIVCTGYMSDVIRKYYSGRDLPYEVVISNEDKPLGTGGAVKNSESLIRSSNILLMNGDSFCPLDLNGFVKFHTDKQSELSLTLVKVDDARDYGTVVIDESNRIVAFAEKKSKKSGLVNAGVYIINRSALSLIPPNTFYSLEHDLFPMLINRNFFGYITKEMFIDIGTPERFKMAQKVLLKMC